MVIYDENDALVPVIPSWPAEQVYLVTTFNHKIYISFFSHPNSRTNPLHGQLIY